MRRSLPLIALLLATACSGGREETRTSTEDLKTYSVSEEPPPGEMAPPPPPVVSADTSRVAGPPGIGPSAAPGVAFNYRYAFRLPGERISAVQEQHAAACEKLGLDRCRITGMRYRLLGEEDVEAMLAFKLDRRSRVSSERMASRPSPAPKACWSTARSAARMPARTSTAPLAMSRSSRRI
jgi:hypothetical protein